MNQNFQRTLGKTDLYFVLLLALTYAFNCFIHFLSTENTVQFMVLLNILYLLLIITYFTSVTVSLICSMLYVFGYGSYILYEVVAARQTISAYSYFWLAIIPLLCLPLAFFRSFLADLQERMIHTAQREDELLGFDEHTQSLNEHVFYYFLPRFMSMAQRGYIKLTVLVIRLRYYDEIRRIIGADGVEQLYREIGKSIDDSTRAEDIPYFTSDGNFVLIAITDAKGGTIVKDRVREGLNLLYIRDRLRQYNLTVDVQIGLSEYDGSKITALELEKQAEKDLEFDL